MSILRYPRVPRILVVDNEPSVCRALSMVLSRDGFQATTALSPEEALARIRDEHFDLLLLDLRLPEMRGDALFHYAVAVQPHLSRRTIFMTGDISQQAADLVAACECPLLLKPFDLREMTSELRKVLGGESSEAVS
jgi:DNA-binding NtrC family response regulator